MYWYSTPAIFKEWQDLVLEHGWAYGSQGNELKGKWFFNATTTGASRLAFKKGEFQNHTVHEFFVPMKQMALLCGMIPLPPFVVHGTHLVTKEGVLSAQQSYHRLLELLVHDRLPLGEILKVNYLNDLLGKEVKNA
ncbi:hypothetical protein PEDI_40290 [Persicobacter diffluens]|uniref:Flavodoxin-like fold domain-containing protein n=1 Tax=Persicobacter diffluens TaxID=981 RepID=A0AAN5AM60_9BACT|nr:hypothetical protein PEDI_40290 [Persicobacter diffluens]